ncbi:MAG TPA: DUF1499 domain-containing protein [Rhizomicrobium sp.]|jgi:hypothetical protein|nr:DUF1499 domain-containing protein [Rhizomicrobium sp.]
MRVLPILGKLAFATFLVALAIGIVSAAGTRLGVWDYHIGLMAMFPWCVFVALGAVALALVWIVIAVIKGTGEGARWAMSALIGAIVLLYTPLTAISNASGMPHIHDITTDIDYPPQFDTLLPLRQGAETPPDYDGAIRVRDNGVLHSTSYLQRKYYGDIYPRGILLPPTKVFWRAFRAAKGMGWNIVSFDPNTGRIEATDTSFFFGITDDIVIRVKPSGQGARVDVRSKSRINQPDLGRDAQGIRDFFKRLGAM